VVGFGIFTLCGIGCVLFVCCGGVVGWGWL
jgi:hypothetical protein